MTARVTLLSTNLARGGAEAQVAQLAAGLRRRDWDVSVISMLTPTAFQRELDDAGVAVFSLHMRPGVWNPLGYARLLGILRALRPRILHGHMFHANMLARAAGLFCPVPVVISTLHSAAESGRASKDVRWRDWCYRLTEPLGDFTVAVAQAVGERHASARAVPPSKLRVIPNGVDTDRFQPDCDRRERVRRALSLGEEFAWLAAGRLMWKKGYDTLLDAFARIQEGVLLIAGSGPQAEELRSLAGENVRFLGQRDDVADLMSACDGFVQSSVVEGLPVALLEAAASGLPCVATNAGGVGEVGTAHIVPPGDPEALARAMREVMSLPVEERKTMGLAGRGQVVARFDQNIVLNMWEELYREMLARWT
jgi:glycosyltransferase involved in cell wall biosynthesis